MKLNARIFRGFSVRGVVGVDFNQESMCQIGRGTGEWFFRQEMRKVVVGHDVRVSSPELHRAFCAGLVKSGLTVLDVGLVPTPVLNFATDDCQADGGVMITASHNTAEYNGLKIRTTHTVFGDDLGEIYQLSMLVDLPERNGELVLKSPFQRYLEVLKGKAVFGRPLKVVVDAGNGANGLVVPQFLRESGLDVVELNCEPDGAFPSRDPDPTSPNATRALAQNVLETRADIGLAFDGDGDRVILVDERGGTIFGDEMLMLVAGYALERREVDKVAYEVLCSHAVPDYIAAKGGIAIPAPSGYAFVHNAMLAAGARLGGEMSGHFFLLDENFRFDDSIVAACRALSILSGQEKPLSALIAALPRYFSSREYRLPCPDEFKGQVVESIRQVFARQGYPIESIDGCSIAFEDAWALVRQSNTQPVLSLRFESKRSDAHMRQVKDQVMARVEAEYVARGLPWQSTLAD
jgi:phosphomannomutase/phosphoglucomutase